MRPKVVFGILAVVVAAYFLYLRERTEKVHIGAPALSLYTLPSK